MMKTMTRGMTVALCLLAGNGATAQEALTELLAKTHVHGLAVDAQDGDRLLIATHHGLYSYGLSSGAVGQVSKTNDDFMGFSPDPAKPGAMFASGHPSVGGNLGVIVSQDGGRTWSKLSDGADGPVDFHAMEVSRADAAEMMASQDGGTTWAQVESP